MGKAEAQAAIKKLDLNLRQLRLKQRVNSRLDDPTAKQDESGDEESRVRKIPRWIDGVIIAMGASGLVKLVLFGVSDLRNTAVALLQIAFLVLWFAYLRQHGIDAPSRLQKEIDTLEAEIAHHKRIVEGAEERGQ